MNSSSFTGCTGSIVSVRYLYVESPVDMVMTFFPRRVPSDIDLIAPVSIDVMIESGDVFSNCRDEANGGVDGTRGK